MNALQVILVVIWASISGIGSVLDEFQTHRPLISCTIIGLILGDIKTGIILGGTLELMALGWMNIGAAMAPDAAIASCISTILVIVSHQTVAEGIAIAIPLAAAGQVLTIFARTLSVGLQHRADRYAEQANFTGVDMCHLGGLVIQALRVAIPVLIVAMFAGTDQVNNMLNAIPDVVTKGLQVAGGFIVVVGYAMVINMMGAKHLMPMFFLGFVVASFSTYNLVALGILGTILAILYLQLSPKYNGVVTSAGAASDDLDDDVLD
ncbi:PTS mannose/fructose/sorbose transporter subunit IIC [Clostridium sp. 'White wine YQ']|uniref:PTS mannose/fructose/sorbose transporter subunit IIC n=1 Tax=Clostridium sp. 'White wine YQ' TaxID=3027474 RepID=UPI00236508BA|nr:PTS mannose/fructose/sorbose transporter subunit IIC [Clostridium sp. 'White wine YQ']MDD7795715.1 PTS mannose/fructose/sorbose transporter subunit IIC [Clostridium sp. 'White wine YQ']